MTVSLARLNLQNARLEFLVARLAYLAATKALERVVYRKDDPTLVRKQA